MSARQRLFQVPPAEFTKARAEVAAELRRAGQRAEAAEVAKLRKPPVALWIVNQLHRLAKQELKDLVDATARVAHAQKSAVHGKGGDELRESMREQREALAGLSDAIGRAGLEAGTKMTLALERRVQNTLQAAAAAESGALLAGELMEELQPAGFEGLLSGAPVAAPPPRPAREKGKDKKEDEKEKEREQEKERKRLQKELQHAEKEVARMEAHAERLAAAAEKAEKAAEAARREAEEAKHAAHKASERALALRSSLGEA